MRALIENGGGDDSMFYGNGFGAKVATNDSDWVTCNGGWGQANQTYFWVNASTDTGGSGGVPVMFEVPSAGTYTIEIGARENGFRIDAFAFGSENVIFSDVELDAAVGDPEIDVIYSISPFNGQVIPADTDIVVTATNVAVTLTSVLDHIEMLLIANNETNDVSSSVISAVTSEGMTFSYANDLASATDYTVEFNIYRSDTAEADSIGTSFSTTQTSYVLVSGTDQAGDQNLIDFLNNNFENISVFYGDYSDYTANATLIENSAVFMIGRGIVSSAYANPANSAAFNALPIPVVAFSSWVTRPDSDRWGWHDGGVGTAQIDGDETTVASAGSTIFGVAEGVYDWFPDGGSFSRPGTGYLGGGELLATIGSENGILAAHWAPGSTTGSGVLVGGERLLFNLNQVNQTTILPSGSGEVALIKALAAYTPLVPSADYIVLTSPTDGNTDIAQDADIVVTVTDVGINWSSMIESYEMRVNSNVVSAVKSSANGVTTFTYSPLSGLEIDSTYDVQLDVVLTGGTTDTVNFSFATAPIYLLDVIITGTSESVDQPLIDFLHNNFKGPIKITYGDYSNFAAHSDEIMNADLFMTGRNFSSSAYDNAEYSAAFNALTTPVVAFSSYIARNAGNRWGWHSGDISETNSVTGAETTVTAAGAGFLGIATGTYDWYEGSNSLNAAGTGTVGTGDILATIEGNIVAAHWNAGDTTGLGTPLGSERLLFNLNKYSGENTIMPSGIGERALINALDACTPLEALSAAAPDILIEAVGSDSVSLSWLTENGVNYNLMRTTSLSIPNWQKVGTRTGNGSMDSTNVTTGVNAEFFRIEVQ